MTKLVLKKKIVQLVDHTDEKILQVIYTILEEHVKLKKEEETSLTEEDVKEFDRRWNNYTKGTTKAYTLEELKKEVRKKVKSIKNA